MSDEIKKQATEILAQLLVLMEKGVGELPSLAEELIFYKRVELTLELVLLLGCSYASYKIARWGLSDAGDEMATVLGGIACPIFCVIAAALLSPTIMVWFAPRLYVISFLRNVV